MYRLVSENVPWHPRHWKNHSEMLGILKLVSFYHGILFKSFRAAGRHLTWLTIVVQNHGDSFFLLATVGSGKPPSSPIQRSRRQNFGR